MKKSRFVAALLSLALAPSGALAEGNNTQSSVQNNNNPQGVVTQQTGGGVNLNQQYNNQWDNHVGFGPGIYCRTPTFFFGGGYGGAQSSLDNGPGASLDNYQISAGILFPFGSSALRDCERMAATLTTRAEVANQVALIKACDELAKAGIQIDPEKFPALKACL